MYLGTLFSLIIGICYMENMRARCWQLFVCCIPSGHSSTSVPPSASAPGTKGPSSKSLLASNADERHPNGNDSTSISKLDTTRKEVKSSSVNEHRGSSVCSMVWLLFLVEPVLLAISAMHL